MSRSLANYPARLRARVAGSMLKPCKGVGSRKIIIMENEFTRIEHLWVERGMLSGPNPKKLVF